MRILMGAAALPADLAGATLAIGNFDGVHRGHQALIARARSLAPRKPTGAMVFEPHPRAFFRPTEPMFRLTPAPRKLELLAGLGLDFTVVMPFDRDLASLTAEAFIADVLVGMLQVGHVVIGYDFNFGKGRSGGPDTMREQGAARGFGVTVVAAVGDGADVFSSSAIRAALRRGDIAAASGMLGHRWQVQGTVIGGAQRGAGLGFPTANLTLSPGTDLAHGIYAVRAQAQGVWHDAAAYLGTRPTFDGGAAVLEVFLLDFDGDLYGEDLRVEFAAFVRPDAAFESADALTAQMARDVADVRSILAANPR